LANDLAALGPFFAVQVHLPADPPPAPWQPLDALLHDLDGRVQAVRRALARSAQRPVIEIEVRPAASIAHLGLVARLLAPVVGAGSLGRELFSLRAGELYWQDELGGPFPLSVTVAGDRPPPLQGDAIETLTLAFAAEYSLSHRVVWGNVASAANSAAQLIAAARPELASKARACADHLLSDPRVEGGQLRAGPMFRRQSCCLIYRIAGDRAAACGDCVLRAPSSA
jgi:hypothetical protein